MSNFVIAGAAPSPLGREPNEIVQRQFMCAEYGLAFLATFTKNGAGVYTCTRSEPMPIHAHDRQGAEAFQDDLPADLIDWSGFKCPFCGADGSQWPQVVRCGSCNEFVCSGRTEGTYFKCHDGCGNEGKLSSDHFKSVKVADGVAGFLGAPLKALGYSR